MAPPEMLGVTYRFRPERQRQTWTKEISHNSRKPGKGREFSLLRCFCFVRSGSLCQMFADYTTKGKETTVYFLRYFYHVFN